VPLRRVADVGQRSAPSLVSHFNAERRLQVGFNARDSDLGTVVVRAQRRAAGLALPPGYRVEWGGQYQTLRAASRRLALIIPAALGLIFAMLALAFRLARPAAIIFTNVPFACVGGMIALWLRGMPVSISAGIGFIALSGVAVSTGWC